MIVTKTPVRITSSQALAIAQDFLFDHLGNLVDVSLPNRIVSGEGTAWIVPLVLTSPGYGIVGIVGTVMIDDDRGDILGWTPIEDIRANAEQLTLQKQSTLEAAFLNLHATHSNSIQIS